MHLHLCTGEKTPLEIFVGQARTAALASALANLKPGFVRIRVAGSLRVQPADGTDSRDKDPCQESLAVPSQRKEQRLTVVLLHR
jgi:hypothetical protein